MNMQNVTCTASGLWVTKTNEELAAEYAEREAKLNSIADNMGRVFEIVYDYITKQDATVTEITSSEYGAIYITYVKDGIELQVTSRSDEWDLTDEEDMYLAGNYKAVMDNYNKYVRQFKLTNLLDE